MNENTQKSLVQKAKSGDPDAFACLFDAHFPMVYGLACSTVRDRVAAEDIAQEVFLSAWKKVGELRNEGAFPMWLRRMTRNLSVSWLRTATYRRALADRHRAEEQKSLLAQQFALGRSNVHSSATVWCRTSAGSIETPGRPR